MLPAEHITNDTRILFKGEKERIILEFSQKSAGCVSILHRDLLLASIYNVKCATSCWKSIINRRRIYSRVVDRVEHGRINQAKRGTFYVASGWTENNGVHASITTIWEKLREKKNYLRQSTATIGTATLCPFHKKRYLVL